jgi:hypothetical protein
MGTNFYHHTKICHECGRSHKTHIGKSSFGWCFALHVYPDRGINSLSDWIDRLEKEGRIYNEYGDELTLEELLDTVHRRSWEDREKATDGWLEENHALAGPKGLARHAIDRYCIGHGEGPWDYIIGEFS